MWKVYLRSTSLIARKEINLSKNFPLRKYDKVGNSILFRGLATQEEILSTNLKQPLKKANSNANTSGQQSSPKDKNSNFKKLLGIFVSGAVSYFAISYYLETKKSKSQGINYESANLPGKIVPSKSVCYFIFLNSKNKT